MILSYDHKFVIITLSWL